MNACYWCEKGVKHLPEECPIETAKELSFICWMLALAALGGAIAASFGT